MSITVAQRLPTGDSPERATARETTWRLAAAAFGHPTAETQDALASGRFHQALNTAFMAVTGRPWPMSEPSEDLAELEAGYIAVFLHGAAGKPIAPLLAGDYEHLLAGHSRPVFMLNIAAFYRHFGLRAATGDEGRADEPDHLVTMLELMAVLSHLEARALGQGRDASSVCRAQRDFLSRYLAPLLEAIRERVRSVSEHRLDPTLRQLCDGLPHLARMQLAELEARVGVYRDRDAASPTLATQSGQGARVVDQNLWG